MSFLLSLVASRFFPYIIIVGVVLAGVFGIYRAGVNHARDLARIAQLQENNRVLQADLAQKKKTAEDDAKKAEADAQVIINLDAKIQEMLHELKDADRQCFDGSDTDSLRKHW